MEIAEYLDEAGANPFREWFDRLDGQTSARVVRVLTRMTPANFGDTKSVGGGILENRIDYGPGYHLYFGRDGVALVILLAGGTKRRQQMDIQAAQRRWSDYKQRKKERAHDRTDPQLQGDRKGAGRSRPRISRRPAGGGDR